MMQKYNVMAIRDNGQLAMVKKGLSLFQARQMVQSLEAAGLVAWPEPA
jgi:hypothetical protein